MIRYDMPRDGEPQSRSGSSFFCMGPCEAIEDLLQPVLRYSDTRVTYFPRRKFQCIPQEILNDLGNSVRIHSNRAEIWEGVDFQSDVAFLCKRRKLEHRKPDHAGQIAIPELVIHHPGLSWRDPEDS